MTAHSQNGFSANDRSVIASYTIPGTTEKIALRKGSAGVILLDIAGFINHEVVGIQQKTLDEWGYAERTIRGDSTTLSNHASGTAEDIDAQKHQLGATGTWTSAQVSKIEARLKLYGGVVRWGRDYHGRKDEMHFELLGPSDGVSIDRIVAVADKIRQGKLSNGAYSYLVGRAPFRATSPSSKSPKVVRNPYPTPKGTVRRNDKATRPSNDVKWVQWALGFTGHAVDGFFGKHTEDSVKSYQRAHRLGVDGVVGPNTKAALSKVTRRA